MNCRYGRDEPVLIAGDFQENVQNSHLMLRLATHGWKCPMLVNLDGTHATATFHSAGKATSIDAILTSPDFLNLRPHVLVNQISGLQHSMLTLVPYGGE